MHLYDISLTLSPSMPVWPGDPNFELIRVSAMENGDHANVSQIRMSAHTGTHVDAPYHFLPNGKTVEQLSLTDLNGRAYILYLRDVNLITADVLEKADIPPRTRRILFRTRNSDLWARGETGFQEDYVALSPDGAQYLVDRGFRLVGIDYLSIAPYGESTSVHQILLKAGVIVVEGLDLSQVSQGRYTLYCLPLKVDGGDGTPARAILIGV
ncbi:MAG: cyclase family protein [Chloroflexota bacterium]